MNWAICRVSYDCVFSYFWCCHCCCFHICFRCWRCRHCFTESKNSYIQKNKITVPNMFTLFCFNSFFLDNSLRWVGQWLWLPISDNLKSTSWKRLICKQGIYDGYQFNYIAEKKALISREANSCTVNDVFKTKKSKTQFDSKMPRMMMGNGMVLDF